MQHVDHFLFVSQMLFARWRQGSSRKYYCDAGVVQYSAVWRTNTRLIMPEI